MPFFSIAGRTLSLVKTTNFDIEKRLQQLIEENLETVFNTRLVASEFPTGALHAGRIDTLGLSEDNNPVIIEYKKTESADLITQSLYYLAWIYDHRGDFEVAAKKALGESVKIDWSDIRVICLSPKYKKFDLHAVKVMGANIELWQYRLFENGHLYIEEIFNKSSRPEQSANHKHLTLDKEAKAAITRANGEYTVNEHMEGISPEMQTLFQALQHYILGLSDMVIEDPKKHYIAYKLTQNFVCIQTYKNHIKLYLKLNPKDMGSIAENMRDVTDIGHYGTGNVECVIKNPAEVDLAKPYIEKAFQNVGG